MHAAYLLALLLPVFAQCKSKDSAPTVYWIRHGEKPDSGNGLSPQGVQRSQCLKSVFGTASSYQIGYILAQTPQSDGSEQRPYDTVKPLADSLGLTVDTTCSRDDAKCVKNQILSYKGKGNILVCWEHQYLQANEQELGAANAPAYPSDHFDLIYADPSPYNKIATPVSEGCPGLDSNSSSSNPSRTMRLRKRFY